MASKKNGIDVLANVNISKRDKIAWIAVAISFVLIVIEINNIYFS